MRTTAPRRLMPFVAALLIAILVGTSAASPASGRDSVALALTSSAQEVTVSFPAGYYVGVQFNVDFTRVTASSGYQPLVDTSMTGGERRLVDGLAYRYLTSGALVGHWVRVRNGAAVASPPPAVKIGFKAGYYVGVKFDSGHTSVVSSKAIQPLTYTSAMGTHKRAVGGVEYVYLTSGSLAGYWIPFKGSGAVASPPPTVRIAFAAGRYRGVEFDVGYTTTVASKTWRALQPRSASGTHKRSVNGTKYVFLTSGALAGYWVPFRDSDAVRANATLPACAYRDVLTKHRSLADWSRTLLDPIYRVPSTYAPDDLISTARAGLNDGYRIRRLVRDDLRAMNDAATQAGHRLQVVSAYRSYQTQVDTFNYWVSVGGYEQALRTSARPGHSEHQLGTVLDFKTRNGPAPWELSDWAATPEGRWMAANAWRYGFVMSYPKGKSSVTCYDYEPWHYRYVGRTWAERVKKSGLSLREYLWYVHH